MRWIPKEAFVYTTHVARFSNEYDGINVYDAETLEDLGFIPIPDSMSIYRCSLSFAINSEQNRIYVRWSGGGGKNQILLFDGATRTLLKTENCTSTAINVYGVNPSTNRVYLYDQILDGSTLEKLSPNNVGAVRAFDSYFSLAYAVYGKEFRIADALTNEILASLTLENTSDVAVNTKTGEIYLADSHNNEVLVVQGPSPSKPLLITDLLIDPFESQIGQPVTISFKVRNLSNNSISYVPTAEVGNEELQQNQIQLGSREVRTLTFTTCLNDPGKYSVSADGLLAYLTVVPEFPSHMILVALLVVTLSTVILAKRKFRGSPGKAVRAN